MATLGQKPATQHVSTEKQTLTGNGGTSYTLQQSVSQAADIEVFVNNTRQEPTVAYTASGNTLTMTGAVNASDSFYVIFQGKAIQTAGLPVDAAITASTITASQSLNVTGHGSFTRGGDTALSLNRETSDGTIVDLQKDGTTVGSIGVDNDTDLVITATDDIFFNVAGASNNILQLFGGSSANSQVKFDSPIFPLTDNTRDIGNSTERWKDLYLSGGVYLGGTGSANQLDDYEEGTWTPTYTGHAGNPTVTYSSQVGSYVKVGKFVFLSFSINTNSVSGGSSSSYLEVSGLPFTCGSQSGDRGALSTVRTQNWVSNVRSPVGGYINAGTNMILLNSYDAGAYSSATPCNTDDLRTTGDSNQLTATVTYITA